MGQLGEGLRVIINPLSKLWPAIDHVDGHPACFILVFVMPPEFDLRFAQLEQFEGVGNDAERLKGFGIKMGLVRMDLQALAQLSLMLVKGWLEIAGTKHGASQRLGQA